MNIYLTYDYELFFGAETGTVKKCLLEPTNELLKISRKYSVPLTFFVDVGYLICLEKNIPKFPHLKEDLTAIKMQIQEMLQLKCSVQLHVHPHWEKAIYEDSRWVIDTTNCYKLHDFSTVEVEEIMTTYKDYLDELVGYATRVFRAGGWCIQPFDQLLPVFKKLGLKVDSSVFVGGHFESTDYFFDFRKAPNKSLYLFEEDVCQEDMNGSFIEVPISSYRYSPLFYWKLYGLGRLFPKQHKMLGDGIFLQQPGRKKSVLTGFTWNHVSSDGFYASKLRASLKKLMQQKKKEMVVIGHPKSNTLYSTQMLEKFVAESVVDHEFKTLDTVC